MLLPDPAGTPLLWELQLGVLRVQSPLHHCRSFDCCHFWGVCEMSSCHGAGIPSAPPAPGHAAVVRGVVGGRAEFAPSPFCSTWTGYFQEKNLSYEALRLPGMCV